MTVKARVDFNIALANRVILDAAEPAMGAVAVEALGMLRVELSQPGTGKEYPRGKSRIHRASKPGRPPAVDYGPLRASTVAEVSRRGGGIIAEVGATREYALALHEGTEKVAARPFADAPIKGSNLQRLLATFRRNYRG
jgi:hypothetical protein